jgi:hypothetical protein
MQHHAAAAWRLYAVAVWLLVAGLLMAVAQSLDVLLEHIF